MRASFTSATFVVVIAANYAVAQVVQPTSGACKSNMRFTLLY